jgi:tripartite ATP-independent transporter DctP family solute receptor
MKTPIKYLTAMVVSAFVVCAPAQAHQKTVIKLGWTTSDGAQDPYAVGARAFKAALEARTNGTIDVQLYPNRQLGDEKAMVEGLRFGTVDAGIITNAVVAQFEPSFQINDMPFLYSSEAQAHKILDGKIGEQLAKKLESKGIITLGYMEGGFRNMVNNKQPVQKPEDVKGVKYRVMQNPVYIDMFSSLGGSAVPMAWGETFTAVQQGTVDGLEAPIAVLDQSKYFEVTKYLSLTKHTYSVNVLMLSKRAFDKLSADQKKAVKEAAKVAVAEQRKSSAYNTRQLIAAFETKGVKVNNVADPAAFRERVKPVYEKFRSSIGDEILNAALAEVK